MSIGTHRLTVEKNSTDFNKKAPIRLHINLHFLVDVSSFSVKNIARLHVTAFFKVNYICIFIMPETGSQKDIQTRKHQAKNKYIAKEINTIPPWCFLWPV